MACSPLLLILSAFCQLVFSSSWVTHLHGQCFTMPRLSWLVLFHAVRLGSSSRLLFPVPTRCAARLLFMNACKATSAEANGMGAPPCSSVNNAFGTNLQFFKDTGGLLSSGAQCCLRAMQILAHVPKWCPSEPLAPSLLSLRGANEGQYNSSKFFFSFWSCTYYDAEQSPTQQQQQQQWGGLII